MTRYRPHLVMGLICLALALFSAGNWSALPLLLLGMAELAIGLVYV